MYELVEKIWYGVSFIAIGGSVALIFFLVFAPSILGSKTINKQLDSLTRQVEEMNKQLKQIADNLEKGKGGRRGEAIDSIVCLGSIISGGQAERSIIGFDTRINSYARVEGSILFDQVDVGRHAKIRRAIIDKEVQIPAGAEVGYDHDLDRRRGFTVTDSGVTVIAKSDGIAHFFEIE